MVANVTSLNRHAFFINVVVVSVFDLVVLIMKTEVSCTKTLIKSFLIYKCCPQIWQFLNWSWRGNIFRCDKETEKHGSHCGWTCGRGKPQSIRQRADHHPGPRVQRAWGEKGVTSHTLGWVWPPGWWCCHWLLHVILMKDAN